MRILIITDSLPYPLNSGPRIRMYNLLRRLATRHQVWLAAPLCEPDENEAIDHLENFCQQIITGRLRRGSPLTHLPGLLYYALAGIPLELRFQYSAELATRIRELVATVELDIVQIVQMRMAHYLRVLPREGRFRRILELYDIDFAQAARMVACERKLSDKLRTGLHSLMMRRWEPRWAERFDRCLTVSEVDRNLLLAANPRLHVDVIPNGVDTRLYTPLPRADEPFSLLFIGNMSYLPCIDAMLYFTEHILPLIRQQVSDVKLWIVGKDPAPEVVNLASHNVHVTGRVDDIIPYYQHARLCVVPLRSGGGTRLKILEAMALGRPVISTTIGCEGLEVVNGEHLLIADEPEEFANHTIRLLYDQDLCDYLTTNARQIVADHYDWDVIANRLMAIYDLMNIPKTVQEKQSKVK